MGRSGNRPAHFALAGDHYNPLTRSNSRFIRSLLKHCPSPSTCRGSTLFVLPAEQLFPRTPIDLAFQFLHPQCCGTNVTTNQDGKEDDHHREDKDSQEKTPVEVLATKQKYQQSTCDANDLIDMPASIEYFISESGVLVKKNLNLIVLRQRIFGWLAHPYLCTEVTSPLRV